MSTKTKAFYCKSEIVNGADLCLVNSIFHNFIWRNIELKSISWIILNLELLKTFVIAQPNVISQLFYLQPNLISQLFYLQWCSVSFIPRYCNENEAIEAFMSLHLNITMQSFEVFLIILNDDLFSPVFSLILIYCLFWRKQHIFWPEVSEITIKWIPLQWSLTLSIKYKSDLVSLSK